MPDQHGNTGSHADCLLCSQGWHTWDPATDTCTCCGLDGSTVPKVTFTFTSGPAIKPAVCAVCDDTYNHDDRAAMETGLPVCSHACAVNYQPDTGRPAAAIFSPARQALTAALNTIPHLDNPTDLYDAINDLYEIHHMAAQAAAQIAARYGELDKLELLAVDGEQGSPGDAGAAAEHVIHHLALVHAAYTDRIVNGAFTHAANTASHLKARP